MVKNISKSRIKNIGLILKRVAPMYDDAAMLILKALGKRLTLGLGDNLPAHLIGLRSRFATVSMSYFDEILMGQNHEPGPPSAILAAQSSSSKLILRSSFCRV